MEYKLGEVCEHGHLKRQCDICELLEERQILVDALKEIKQQTLPCAITGNTITNASYYLARKALDEVGEE